MTASRMVADTSRPLTAGSLVCATLYVLMLPSPGLSEGNMLLAARIVLREYVVKSCGLAVPKWGTKGNITAPRTPGRHIGVTELGTVANSTAILGTRV